MLSESQEGSVNRRGGTKELFLHWASESWSRARLGFLCAVVKLWERWRQKATEVSQWPTQVFNTLLSNLRAGKGRVSVWGAIKQTLHINPFWDTCEVCDENSNQSRSWWGLTSCRPPRVWLWRRVSAVSGCGSPSTKRWGSRFLTRRGIAPSETGRTSYPLRWAVVSAEHIQKFVKTVHQSFLLFEPPGIF